MTPEECADILIGAQWTAIVQIRVEAAAHLRRLAALERDHASQAETLRELDLVREETAALKRAGESLIESAKALERENAGLREALRWYVPYGDLGERAREALHNAPETKEAN
jgi:hypothetical protein